MLVRRRKEGSRSADGKVSPLAIVGGTFRIGTEHHVSHRVVEDRRRRVFLADDNAHGQRYRVALPDLESKRGNVHDDMLRGPFAREPAPSLHIELDLTLDSSRVRFHPHPVRTLHGWRGLGSRRAAQRALGSSWLPGLKASSDSAIFRSAVAAVRWAARIERSWSHVPGRMRLRQIRDAVSKVRRELRVKQGEPDLDLARVFLAEALPSITAAFVDERNVVEHGIQAVAGGLLSGRDQRVHLRCRTTLVQPHRGKCSCAIKVPGARPESAAPPCCVWRTPACERPRLVRECGLWPDGRLCGNYRR